MAFPSTPADGDIWVEGGRQFIFDSTLPGWRLTGSTGSNLEFNGFRIENIGNAVNNGDAVNLGQVTQMIGSIAGTAFSTVQPPNNPPPGGLWATPSGGLNVFTGTAWLSLLPPNWGA